MKRLDRLIIKEMIGPWLFGVAMFTVLIVAAVYLTTLSNYIVKGIPGSMVAELLLLVLPGVLVKTFAMAMLLAGLLGFGRLSGDSEIVAIRAAGASMFRIMQPVALFASFVALIAFGIDETLVPWAAKQSEAIVQGLARKVDKTALHPTTQPIVDHGKTVGVLTARDFNAQLGTLSDATIITYDKSGKNSYYLWAHLLTFDPVRFQASGGSGWGITGGATLLAADGSGYYKWDNKIWPPSSVAPKMSVDELIAGELKNLDVLSMKEIQQQIAMMRSNPNHLPEQLANLEFGYWNKIALPLAAFIYGLLGAPLGIRPGRATAAGGFALAVAIIFAYITMGNLLNIYAMGGVIKPWVSSFTPLAIGLVASIVIMWRRNL